ncbi:hypothetical protein QBC41DRAFT_308528 [Cercophora samala]|uniref:Uncharacterized protein n=1 Tax=Cercophora samala TaxID=330535 RepID=A0AA39YFN2_9PEZI|nr:hypothetical protein QBC41DRAFT_308528 [Cercophora samala]
MADESVKEDKVSRVIRVKGKEVSVAVAAFTMDLLASDGTDEDADILLMDGETIEKNDKEMRDKLLQANQTKTEEVKTRA